MYKMILVPLDGSKRAESILPHVISLAERYNSKIVFLRIEEPELLLERDEVADFSVCQREFEKRRLEAEEYLKAKKKDFTNMGFETETHVKFGSVVKTILSEAEACGAEIIAMSSHGMGGLTSMFYGSVAAGVLNRIDRPLLIIRTQNHA